MTAEQAIFASMKTLATGDTGVGGLYESGGAAYIHGGVFLADERPQLRSLPRLMFSFSGPDRWDGDSTEIANIMCRIIVECDRNTAFGTGDTPEAAGTLSTICDRVKTVYDGQPLTVTGWTVADMHIARGPYTAPSDEAVVRRVIEIPFIACKS